MNFYEIKEKAKRLGFIYTAAHKCYELYLESKKSIKAFRLRERKLCYGNENPDKTFYVIGVNYSTSGLYSIVKSVYCHIYYALQKGYIPVVDMQNYKSQLSDGVENGNAWEAFFYQPCGYSLKDIEKSENIIKSSRLLYPEGVEIGFDTVLDDEWYKKYHGLYHKHVVTNDIVTQYADMKYEKVIGNKKNVLGVLCRGTDYTENKPFDHPIQPSIEQAIGKVKEVVQERGYEYVFLATEDKKYYDRFKQELGDKLLFSGQKLYEGMNGVKYLCDIPVSSFSEKWQNIVDYHATIHILSKCNGLVTGLTCGSICAYLMTEGYDFAYFWNLGKYK